MKRTTRSAAALVSTTVLAGAGIAAAVTGVSGPSAPAASSAQARPASASDPALSAAVQQLLARSAALHDRLDVTHHQLRVLDHRLHLEHQAAARLARRPAMSGAGTAPAQSPAALQASAAAGVHTTTRASASAGGGPRVHTTTRASGGGGRPGVHTTTRASAGGGEHESERGHDD